MTIFDKLTALIDAISKRGVGHTSLMKRGTDSYERPFLQIGSTLTEMKQAGLDQNPNCKLCTIEGIASGKAKGLDLPVAIDNYVIREVMLDALLTLESMKVSLEAKNQVMEELMNIIEYYQDRAHSIETISMELAVTPWYKVRKLISLEKRIHQMILEYNSEENPVEEAFNRILKIAKQDQ